MTVARALPLTIGAVTVLVISFVSTSLLLDRYFPIRGIVGDGVVAAGSVLRPIVSSPERLGGGLNLAWPSEDFTSPRWARYQIATVEPHAARALNGDYSASRIIESKDNGRHFIDITLTDASPSAVHSFSVFFKPVDRLIRLEMRDKVPGKYGTALCNPPKGDAVGSFVKAANVVDGGVEDAGDGWYRCWASMPFNLSDVVLTIELRDENGLISYQGNGNSGVLIWGAQFEPYTRPGVYLPAINGPIASAN